jgi:hypothetical protein
LLPAAARRVNGTGVGVWVGVNVGVGVWVGVDVGVGVWVGVDVGVGVRVGVDVGVGGWVVGALVGDAVGVDGDGVGVGVARGRVGVGVGSGVGDGVGVAEGGGFTGVAVTVTIPWGVAVAVGMGTKIWGGTTTTGPRGVRMRRRSQIGVIISGRRGSIIGRGVATDWSGSISEAMPAATSHSRGRRMANSAERRMQAKPTARISAKIAHSLRPHLRPVSERSVIPLTPVNGCSLAVPPGAAGRC